MKQKFFARIKAYTWNGTTVSDCVDLKAKTLKKAEKEANKILKKLRKENQCAVYELEGIYEDTEQEVE